MKGMKFSRKFILSAVFFSRPANVINHTRAHFFSSFPTSFENAAVLGRENREDYWKRINADRSRTITLSSVRPKKDVKSRHIKNAQASLIKFKLKRQPKKFDRAVFFQREYVNAWGGHERNLFKFLLWNILRKLISTNKKPFSRFFFPTANVFMIKSPNLSRVVQINAQCGRLDGDRKQTIADSWSKVIDFFPRPKSVIIRQSTSLSRGEVILNLNYCLGGLWESAWLDKKKSICNYVFFALIFFGDRDSCDLIDFVYENLVAKFLGIKTIKIKFAKAQREISFRF